MTDIPENPADVGTNSAGKNSPGQATGRRMVLLAWGMMGVFLFIFPFAFVNYEIYVDEGWLGQQAYSLAAGGHVTSEFFRDAAPLDGTIVLYHKLLIWCGAALTRVAGWSLYTLRAVSLLSGLALILLVMFARRQLPTPSGGLLAAIVLLFTPLYFNQMIIFRPEMLVTLLGFASYLLLEKGITRPSVVLIALAGILAGLSGLAHAAGMAFAIAGGVTLLVERRLRFALLYVSFAILAFSPYVSGWWTDRNLFVAQAFHNKLISGNFSLPWWSPLLNLLEEHKRWFRKPEVIGLSVLFVLALLQNRRADFRRHRVFWIFLSSLAAVLAMAPLPKITRYMLPLAPFFAIAIADRWISTLYMAPRFSGILRKAFVLWTIVFLAFGVGRLGWEGFLHPNRQIEVNHQIASHIPEGSVVLAPFDFVFNEQPHYIIQSYRGARFAADDRRSAEFLETYADSLGVRYLVLSPEEAADWRLDTLNPGSSFLLFTPVAIDIPNSERWLVRRNQPETGSEARSVSH